MMLHSTILAFGANVPAVCIGYDKKNLSFMQLTGQERRYIEANNISADKLIQLVDSVLFEEKGNNLQKTNKLLQARKLELERQTQAFTNRVIGILSGK
jgi:polysaccharide pyruvyl transferase WcaK-like protein